MFALLSNSLLSLFAPAVLSPQVTPSATESCFARQHTVVSDNNNQCFSAANGHLPSQLAAQRPGAIDNQSLVTTDPIKARPACLCVKGVACVFGCFLCSLVLFRSVELHIVCVAVHYETGCSEYWVMNKATEQFNRRSIWMDG